jgi:hypothetical protein
MDFCIKVNKESETNIVIETPAELGSQVYSLLLKEGYSFIEFHPEAIGRSINDGFALTNNDTKYYSLMVLVQKKETDVSDIATCIHIDFGGNLTHHGNNYMISSDENDFATI